MPAAVVAISLNPTHSFSKQRGPTSASSPAPVIPVILSRRRKNPSIPPVLPKLNLSLNQPKCLPKS